MLSTTAFLAVAMQCAATVHPSTSLDVARVESGYNPYAIAEIVPRPERKPGDKGFITHMPKSKEDAVSIITQIEAKGRRYSVGLMQITSTNFKQLIYEIQNPETAEWAAKMTGSILVDDEMRKVRTDLSLTEKMDTDRMIRQAESYYVDSNMFLNLPEKVGFVFTTKELAKATKMSPILVKKKHIELLSFENPQSEQPQTEINEQNKPSINL
ncbi:transglycosylase SLT domain-containing protein [Escherichia coli]|uniref:transglycosylase SLT domain-containing protein n=1 Tax=Escherichia coli TaxID=562 RepID=UPI000CFBE505|nr:transglycosylase SLT domain-containing protein [Escherichia coli]